MSFSEDDLYRLLPAIYRIRDENQGGEIKALLSVIAEQVKAIDEDLSQLYDDHFIETCASWAIPYIGDLIGARGLDPKVTAAFSQRAAVANTLAYRRRKGTAAILEQLAQDVMGIPAKVVEYFRLITATQNLNHVRSACHYSPNLRDRSLLQDLDTPFDRISHSVDVRRISAQRGLHNIANIGIFLWRLQSFPLTKSIAYPVDRRRFLFSVLGNDAAIYSRRESEENISHLAEKLNIPMPITRQMLKDDLDAYYGRNRSILISVGGEDVLSLGSNDLSLILDAGDLSDIMDSQGNVIGWSAVSDDKIIIDPVRGRISFPKDQEGTVQVTYHYGFSAAIGGGEYERLSTLDSDLTPVM
ncbi:MAG TPA: phage tail protein, partial [Methanothrix sp.]|nr:phage tail protein [Methanothrix sp.]